MEKERFCKVKTIAIILARGGSKRIPKKNIKPFLGKPIIAYSIEAAIQSGLFEEVMVSTDDENIAEIAKNHGANVPFLRSNSTSNDQATTIDALIEVINTYGKNNIYFDVACCLYPTAPFITPEKLTVAYNKLITDNLDVSFPVIRFSYPIWRSLKIEDNKMTMNWPEYMNSRSQDLSEAYHDAGQFYFFKVNTFLKEKKLFGNNSGGIIIDEMEGQDIDNETDWIIAEIKYKLLKEQYGKF